MDLPNLQARRKALLVGDRRIRLASLNEALVEVGVKEAAAMAASDFALRDGEEALLDSDEGAAVVFWDALEICGHPLSASDVLLLRHFPPCGFRRLNTPATDAGMPPPR